MSEDMCLRACVRAWLCVISRLAGRYTTQKQKSSPRERNFLNSSYEEQARDMKHYFVLVCTCQTAGFSFYVSFVSEKHLNVVIYSTRRLFSGSSSSSSSLEPRIK